MEETIKLAPLFGFHICCAFALVSLSWIFIHRWRQMNIKSPKTWPFIASTIEQLINYERMHDWLTEYLAKSKTVTVKLPFKSYTYIADPVNVEHVLKTNFRNYPKGEVYRSYMDVLLGDGIFNADGELWRNQRKTASFQFASKNLRDFSTHVFREYALKLSRILARRASTGSAIDLQDLFLRMTLDSICEVGFGVEVGTLAPDLPENRFAQAFDAANAVVMLRFVDPFWRIKRLLGVGSEALLAESIKAVDEFTYGIIRKRKAEIEQRRDQVYNQSINDPDWSVDMIDCMVTGTHQVKHDILSRFIELGDEGGGDKSLRDVVLNFVIAGRDTTAATMSWFVYMMVNHPRVAEKLCGELKEFEQDLAEKANVPLIRYENKDVEAFAERIAQFAGLLSYESLARLNYLHACISETLRLYPAVAQDLKGALEDDVLPDGTKVKAGEMVTYVPYAMGRMEYNWGPDAALFDPERWFKDGLLQTFSPFKFTAFQAGPRICLGKDSAYLQMKMTLAILCRFFTFNLVPNHQVRYKMMTTLSMAHGLKVYVGIKCQLIDDQLQ
ncbi:Cytochrome P450 [Canna indica]|uniref:Cytochrome P450 n=1 Tax=Canna indica TaxID=4628 RepID=A0AAQ3K4W9_9LILI|nr:Cytochrome P450 [Canna indica]